MNRYRFGPYHLDSVKRLLYRNGESVHLTPKALEILLLLVERRGEIVEKDEIIRRVWRETIVEEGNLSVHISSLRKALGENLHEHQYIITHPGRGYRFVAEVTQTKTDGLAQSIEPAGGALPLSSPFYIDRSTDEEFFSAIDRRDSIVLVKGPRQVGKTSLLARGLQKAREQGNRVVLTDFQNLNASHLESIEKLFLMLGELIADQLDLKVHPDQVWNPHIGPSSNFERYWRREVLSKIDSPVVWGLDEVDRLFNCDFAGEVFGLVRSWYNRRALDPEGPWSRLTMAMAYATEAHLFIADLNQSPFNVGTRLRLDDFTLDQVAELNRRYGSPLERSEDLLELHRLVGGHPYLVNLAFWEIKTHGLKLERMTDQADLDENVFKDHLRRLQIALSKDVELASALLDLLNGKPGLKTDIFYRLRSAGIVKGNSSKEAAIRCELYRVFLQTRL